MFVVSRVVPASSTAHCGAGPAPCHFTLLLSRNRVCLERFRSSSWSSLSLCARFLCVGAFGGVCAALLFVLKPVPVCACVFSQKGNDENNHTRRTSRPSHKHTRPTQHNTTQHNNATTHSRTKKKAKKTSRSNGRDQISAEQQQQPSSQEQHATKTPPWQHRRRSTQPEKQGQERQPQFQQ